MKVEHKSLPSTPKPTYRMLWAFYNELLGMENRGSVMLFLNQGKIKSFLKANNQKLMDINLFVTGLAKEYFEHDSDGKVMKSEGADSKGNKQVIFKTGKTQEEYTNVLQQYMSTECVINL